MKNLQFEYSTRLQFDAPVSGHSFTLRCLPASDDRQIINEPECVILPGNAQLWNSRDSFGNLLLCGLIKEPHDHFSFRVLGTASVRSHYKLSGTASPIYDAPSPLTVPGEKIQEFHRRWKTGNAPTHNKPDILDKALSLCGLLCQCMTYERGKTQVNTTAEEALILGAGVCQDYVHIFLSLCRLEGIRCRYVSGLAFHTGETHAWAEINDGECWYGIDPTNNCLIHGPYIKLCHGRDYADCPIERGIYTGFTASTQTVTSHIQDLQNTQYPQ